MKDRLIPMQPACRFDATFVKSLIKFLPAVTLAVGLPQVVRAQGYSADASISATAAGNNTYDYTITLNNEAAATSPIAFFWFAWVPDVYGYDLLASPPTVTQTPSGWSDYVAGGSSYYYPDGYSIEFYTYGSPLAPGNSLTFKFNSADPLSAINGTSPYLGIPATTSYVYSDVYLSNSGERIVVQPVPEPASWALVSIGLLGLAFVAWRHWPLNSEEFEPTQTETAARREKNSRRSD